MINKKKVALVIVIFIALFVVIRILPGLFNLIIVPADKFIVVKGELSNQEITKGIIIRDEEVLGNNQKNIEKIISEGKKVAVGDKIGRYFSDEENKIILEIEKIEKEINLALAENNKVIKSSENILLDSKIELALVEISRLNNQEKITEQAKEINKIILEKAKLSGELSKEGSKAKKLIDEKERLEKQLSSNTEAIISRKAGFVSYKVDGYEDKLKVDKLSELSKKLLESVEVKLGNQIPTNDKNVKVVNGYTNYIATIMSSEESTKVEKGDNINLKIDNNEEMQSVIKEIIPLAGKERIIVFEVNRQMENLLKYRKVNVAVVWWSKLGLKVNNNSIVKIDEDFYISKNKVGFTEIVPIKINKKTEEYSLIEPLTKKDYEQKNVKNLEFIPTIQEYDEIILNPKITREDVKKFVGK